MGYILSIDQGTTGTTALLIESGEHKLIGKVNNEFPQIFPTPSQVEHNLNDIWASVKRSTQQVLENCNVAPDEIIAIGITNQRETTCAFNKAGDPLANAIVWQDRRTADFCEQIKKRDDYNDIVSKTGLPVDPYFSATKMNWLLSNNTDVKSAADNDDLRFGTIDTFLLYKLTAGGSFATEASNASRTLLMDLESCEWSDKLIDIFEVNKSFLPEIKGSFGNFGVTSGLDFLPDGIPITGILGDQQAALFGQAGFTRGEMKCTYGTGAFLLLNTGEEIVKSKNGLLTTVAYKHKGKACYALEGSTYIAGAAVQWLRDNMSFFKESHEVEAKAREVKDIPKEMAHLLFMPFFTGIGTPHWNSEAKATITGMTRDTNQSHLSLACLDGIALSIQDCLAAMTEDLNEKINTLKVDGGAVKNDLLMEIQATISDLEIVRPQVIETTGYGAALGAAVGLGKINMNILYNLWKKDQSFTQIEQLKDHYNSKKSQWNSIISRMF
jgi:glycerol kinase